MDEIIVLKPEHFFTNDAPICITKYAYDQPEQLHLHTHDFVEIVYVCRGKGLHTVNGSTFPVSKGDVFIINYNTPHSFYPNDPYNTDHLEVYNCMFVPPFITQMGIELPILNAITGILLFNGLYPDERKYSPDLKLTDSVLMDFHSLFERMHQEYTLRQEGYIDMLKMLLCELLIKIYRCFKDVDSLRPDTYKLQLIQKSIQFLKDNYAEPLQLKMVSDHAFLSRSYFASLFKKTTGMSVFDYLQKVRIDEACRLLEISPDTTITEIAEKVGYKDYRFFNKVFRKFTGITAQAYRKNSLLNHGETDLNF